MNAELFTVIAALGLLLSAAGVFAVLALAVAARRREIGIRVAVGADRISIAKSILGPIGGSVLVGLGIGLAGAFGVTRLIGNLLWGVAPADPLALGVGVGVLLIAVVLAIAAPLRESPGNRSRRLAPCRVIPRRGDPASSPSVLTTPRRSPWRSAPS